MSLNDVLIVLKLVVFGIYYWIEVVIRNIVPKRLLVKNIKGNVVLITGAAGGIGRCLVEEFLQHECYVIAVDKEKSALAKLEIDFKRLKSRLFIFEADLSSLDQITDIYTRIKQTVEGKIGRPVDILINNAGIMNKFKSVIELTDVELRSIFDINILCSIRLCQLFVPEMIRRNQGHIVNVSSSLGVFGAYRVADYCATKFALFGFSEALRVELKTSNPENQVKVTIVCPFHVRTPLFGDFELPNLKWLSTSVNPEFVAKSIFDGIRLDKEIIGCPSWTFFGLSAIKFMMPTKLNDYLQHLSGFEKAVERYKSSKKD